MSQFLSSTFNYLNNIDTHISDLLLSRLLITGPVNKHTPLVVIIEIANAHGLRYDSSELYNPHYVDRLIEKINITHVPSVSQPFNKHSYSAIARFVNNNCNWTRSSLMSAFHFLISFFHPDIISHINPSFEYGLQTPDSPYRLNACVLYGICKHYGIITSYSTSLASLANNIMLLNRSQSDLHSLTLQSISSSSLPKHIYISLLSLINSSDDHFNSTNLTINTNNNTDSTNLAINGSINTNNDTDSTNLSVSTDPTDFSHNNDNNSTDFSHNNNNSTTFPDNNNTTDFSDNNNMTDFADNNSTDFADNNSTDFADNNSTDFADNNDITNNDSSNITDNNPTLSTTNNNLIYSLNTDNTSINSSIDNNSIITLDEHINYNDLARAARRYRELRRNQNLHIRIPTTKIDAIALAAVTYEIDISESKDPIQEYRLMLNQPTYLPLDKTLQLKIASQIPELDSPHLNESFNPYLPVECYKLDTLQEHARNYGIENITSNLNELYENLQLLVLSSTFYHGKANNLINSQSDISLDNIVDLPFDQVLSYGIRGQSMYAYTYDDLKNTFDNCRRFQMPNCNDGTQFPSTAIDKLLILASTERKPTESFQLYNIRRELTTVIRRIKLYQQNTNRECQNLLLTYDTSPLPLQNQINTTFLSLHRLAMFMRGWDGHGPLPISYAPVDNQAEVDILVSETIVQFEHYCQQLSNIGDLILSLPIFKYRNGQYVTSNNRDDGYTIRDRLNIIKIGESSDNLSSCIRLSSNWFSSTSYYYMNLLRIELPYDINQLSYIS